MNRGVRWLFLSLFFISGFAALMYQIIWQRILTFFSGADLDSVTMIVGAFMAGMGLGSLAGGYLADRLSPRGRILAFAGAEFAVAVFALASTRVYYDFLYVHLGAAAMPRVAVGCILFAVTLWPTTWMGMSLPLASRILTADTRQPARWLPALYGWNTLGAACGALATVTMFLPWTSFDRTLAIGAALNGLCGTAVLLAGRGLTERAPAPPAPGAGGLTAADDPPPRTSPSRLGWRAWMAAYALAGFVALSLEILWFRILEVAIKSTSSTFGILLAIYLAGLGLGALVMHHWRFRSWRPAQSFLLLQAAIPIYAAAAVVVFVFGVTGIDWAHPLRVYLGSYDGSIGFRRINLLLYGAIPLVLVGIPTTLMGASFGFLQRAVHTDVNLLGRRVGWLQAANIVGAVAGTLITGHLLLNDVGTTGTLRLLLLASVTFIWLHERASAPRANPLHVGIAAAVAIATGALVPSGSSLWAVLHGSTERDTISAEGRTGLSILKMEADGTTVVFSNGLGQSLLPYGDIHTMLGALPSVIHPRPAAVAVIGLGSGDTAWASGGRRETLSIDCIEIVAPQIDALRALSQRRGYAGLGMLLRDRRVRYAFTDGRTFLRNDSRRYDVIEADAIRPQSAYSGNLYSVEYFELLRDRLNPGGLSVTWLPTTRVRDTIMSVFPYTVVFGEIAIGSVTPISVDAPTLKARLGDPAFEAYYASGGVDIRALLDPVVAAGPSLSMTPASDRTALRNLNRDLFPKDEFQLP